MCIRDSCNTCKRASIFDCFHLSCGYRIPNHALHSSPDTINSPFPVWCGRLVPLDVKTLTWSKWRKWAMYLFLNCELGPSQNIQTQVMFGCLPFKRSLTTLHMNTATDVLSRFKSSETMTSDSQQRFLSPDFVQITTVNRVTWSWLQCADWTSPWYLQLKFSAKSTCTTASSSVRCSIFSLKILACCHFTKTCSKNDGSWTSRSSSKSSTVPSFRTFWIFFTLFMLFPFFACTICSTCSHWYHVACSSRFPALDLIFCNKLGHFAHFLHLPSMQSSDYYARKQTTGGAVHAKEHSLSWDAIIWCNNDVCINTNSALLAYHNSSVDGCKCGH